MTLKAKIYFIRGPYKRAPLYPIFGETSNLDFVHRGTEGVNKFKVLYVAVLCGGPTDERGGLSPQKIMTVLRNEIVNLMKQKRRTDWQLRREGTGRKVEVD